MVECFCSPNTANPPSHNSVLAIAESQNSEASRSREKNTEDKALSARWNLILHMPDKGDHYQERQDLSKRSRAIAKFDDLLLSTLFLEDSQLSVAEALLNSKNNGTNQVISSISPILACLLAWKYKLKPCVLFDEERNNYDLEKLVLQDYVLKTELFLVKIIFIICYKKVRDGKLGFESVTKMFCRSEQFFKNCFTEIMKLCQAMYKIDSKHIEICREEMSHLFGMVRLSVEFTEFLTNYEGFLDNLKRCENDLSTRIKEYRTTADKKILNQLEELHFLLENLIEKFKTFKNKPEIITKKTIRFFNGLLWSKKYEAILRDARLQPGIKILADSCSEIERVLYPLKTQLEAFKRIVLLDDLFEIFVESLQEIEKFNSSIDGLFLKPDLPFENIVFAKTALIICEGKECYAEEIEVACSKIARIDVGTFVLCDSKFKEGILSLLHSVAEYMLKKGQISIQNFEFARFQAALDSFFNKDKLLIKDIIDLYSKMRGCGDKDRPELWPHIIRIQSTRTITNENRRLEIDKARGVFIAFYMMRWNIESLKMLKSTYFLNYCDMNIPKNLNEETN